MSGHQVKCWCPSCGRVRTDYEPLPFCRHYAEASSLHHAVRMERLSEWHPFLAASTTGASGATEEGSENG